MVETHTASKTPRRLSDLWAEAESWPLADRLTLVRSIANQVRALHDQGRTHRAVRGDSVSVDAKHHPQLDPPAPPGRFGGEGADPELCPPELLLGDGVELPDQIEAAATALQQGGYALAPRRIDVYQLGTLLCRLLTGESILGYMYDPAVQAKIPGPVKSLLRQALGDGDSQTFEDCDSLIAAFDESLRQLPESEPSTSESDTPAGGSVIGAQSDTPPHGHRSRAAKQKSGDLPFERLGPYRVTGRIGSGGMGDVYRGRDESLHRDVALKVLPPEMARDEDFVRRFKAEAAGAARLTHENVVPVYFIGEDDGHHFFSMRLIDGEPLSDRLDRAGRLPLDEALELLEQCLAGLGAAHSENLIHRDIKPGNILLDRETGQAVLVDFGLVRRIGQHTRMTATGMVMGTVDYMAPEQARGQKIDCRADIYALGVLFYQTLAGRLPFEAETPTAMMFQHAYEEPFPLREAVPDAPQPMISIVARMMAKSPDDRYASCEKVLADVAAFREGRALAPAPEQGGSRSRKTSGPKLRNSGYEEGDPTAELAAADVALPENLDQLADDRPLRRARDFAATMFRRHAPDFVKDLQSTTQQVDGAVAEYERRQRRLTKLRQEALDIIADLNEQISANRLAVAAAGERAAETTDPDQTEATLARQQQCEEDLAALESQHAEQERQLEEIELQQAKTDAKLAQLRSQRDILQARLKAAHAAHSLDAPQPRRKRLTGKRVLVAGGALAGIAVVILFAVLPRLLIVRPDLSPDEPPSVPMSETTSNVVSRNTPTAGSPSGATETNLNPMDPTKADLLAMFRGHENWVTGVAFLSGGTELVTASRDDTVRFWDVATAESLGSARSGAHFPMALAVTPDTSLIAIGHENGPITLMPTRDRQVSETLRGHSQNVWALEFSPDGSLLASGSDDATVRIWDMGIKQTILTLPHPDRVTAVAFSPDGTLLATASVDQTVRFWDVSSGKPARDPIAHDAPVQSVAFSPDGSLLATGSQNGRLLLWDALSGQLVREFETHPHRVECVTFSPDGATLVAGSGYTQLNLWDVATGKLLRALLGDKSEVLRVVYSPDGSQLVSVGREANFYLWGVDPNKKPPAEQLSGAGHDWIALAPLVQKDRDTKDAGWKWDGTTAEFGAGKPRAMVYFPVDVTGSYELQTHLTIKRSKAESAIHLPVGNNNMARLIMSADGGNAGGPTATLHLKGMDPVPEAHSEVTMHCGTEYTLLCKVVVTPQKVDLQVHRDDNLVFEWSGDVSQISTNNNDRPRTIALRTGYYSSLSFRDLQLRMLSGKATPPASSGATPETPSKTTGSPTPLVKGPGPAAGQPLIPPTSLLSRPAKIQPWNPAIVKPLATLHEQTGLVRAFGFTPDGSVLISASDDRTIRAWNLPGGEPRGALPPLQDEVRLFVFSSDGSLTAAAGKTQITLLETATGKELGTLAGHAGGVTDLAFSPDGSLLASTSADMTVKTWEVATRRLKRSFEGHTSDVLSVTFSPDGTGLVAGSKGNKALWWDVATGELQRQFLGATGIAELAFSPDSSLLACGCHRSVGVKDVATTKNYAQVGGYGTWPHSIAFHPDGSLMASRDVDGVRLWDVKTKQPLGTLPADRVTLVAFSPDGSILAAGGDKVVQLWSCGP